MAFERVLDLKTGRESWVDFLPASNLDFIRGRALEKLDGSPPQ